MNAAVVSVTAVVVALATLFVPLWWRTRYYAGDWDVAGSSTLDDELWRLGRGRIVGERRHIDEVRRGRLRRTHVVEWTGTAWTKVR